jgi:hypothetical protein
MWFKLSRRRWYDSQNIGSFLRATFGVVAAAIATDIAILDAITTFA